METNYDEDELLEIIKLNGQTVSNALAMLKSNATEREISDYISNYTGQPHNLVAREVVEILRFAVGNGFLLKNGNTYTIPSLKHIYNLDHATSGNSDQTDSKKDESGRSANEPVRSGDDPDSIVGSGVIVKDTRDEVNETTCEGGVKEEG